MAITTSSGPGIALKGEAMGLAIILELPGFIQGAAYTLDIRIALESHDIVFEAVFQNQSSDHGCTRGIALVGTYLDDVLGLS